METFGRLGNAFVAFLTFIAETATNRNEALHSVSPCS